MKRGAHPPNPVHVHWHADSERMEGTIDHGMLIVPEGETGHRVYFVSQSVEQLARMTAVVLEMAARNAGGRPLEIALEILREPGRGEFR